MVQIIQQHEQNRIKYNTTQHNTTQHNTTQDNTRQDNNICEVTYLTTSVKGKDG